MLPWLQTDTQTQTQLLLPLVTLPRVTVGSVTWREVFVTMVTDRHTDTDTTLAASSYVTTCYSRECHLERGICYHGYRHTDTDTTLAASSYVTTCYSGECYLERGICYHGYRHTDTDTTLAASSYVTTCYSRECYLERGICYTLTCVQKN